MIDAETFLAKTGREPIQDDLVRCNCPQAGEPGHWSCGWCAECDLPRFMCRDWNHIRLMMNGEHR